MSSATEISVHPQVIMSIADHYSRRKAQSPSTASTLRVMGILLGIQIGQRIDISQCIEINPRTDATASASASASATSSTLVFDPNLMKNDVELFKKVFPTHEILGWYCTGADMTDDHKAFHNTTATTWNENPLFLLLDPTAGPEAKELPIKIFESEMHVVKDAPTRVFVQASYKVESFDSERVVVDHVAKVASAKKHLSAEAEAYAALRDAVNALLRRVQVLLAYLQDVDNKSISPDFELLRSIKTIINRLPAVDSEKFRAEFYKEYNDSLLITYLSSVSKTESLLNDVIEKSNTIHMRPREKEPRERPFSHGIGGFLKGFAPF